ncbi:hypothetical protein BDW69DRAFT_164964 [Aspergillus filifer]
MFLVSLERKPGTRGVWMTLELASVSLELSIACAGFVRRLSSCGWLADPWFRQVWLGLRLRLSQGGCGVWKSTLAIT